MKAIRFHLWYFAITYCIVIDIKLNVNNNQLLGTLCNLILINIIFLFKLDQIENDERQTLRI